MTMGNNSLYLFLMIEMIFILSFIKTSTFLSRKAVKFYCWSILANVLSYGAHILRNVFANQHLVVAAKINEAVLYGFAPMIACFLFMYSCQKNKVMYQCAMVIQSLYFVFCYSSIFTESLFVIDSTGAYSRGPLSFISFVYAAGLIFIWLVYVLFDYKSSTIKEKMKMFLMVFIEFGAMIAEFVDSTYKFSIIGSSFLLIVFYVFLMEIEGKYDKATKVFNKRYYSIVTSNLVNNYTVVIFDINRLKYCNDTYGHEAGDSLIRAIADSIKSNTQGGVYRIGGDEFVIISKETKKDEIEATIEKILQSFVMKQAQLGFEVSASVGYCINLTENDFTNVFRIADVSMYKNKSEYYRTTRNARRIV